MSDPNKPVARMRSLGRLLEYSLTEARELQLDEVAQFLALASAAFVVSKASSRKPAARGRTAARASDTVVHLREFRNRQPK